MQPNFTHLHLHTEYSLVDSLLRIKPLMNEVSKRGMQAVALTDFFNLFAVVKFYKAAIAKGIKPIIGCEFLINNPDGKNDSYSLVLLCQNEAGYLNLTKLSSKAYQEGQIRGKLRIEKEWLIEHADGLIALSAGREGNIGQALLANDEELAYQLAKESHEIFPNRFYLEIQRTGREGENLYNQLVVKLADKINLPLVATNDVRFLNEVDYHAHEARVCIQQGCTLNDAKRERKYNPKQYLRSASEMQELFKDLPQALQNSVEISVRCSVKLKLDEPCLPNFPIPENLSSVEDYLSVLASEGLDKRLKHLFPGKDTTDIRVQYDERLKVELKVINSMGFASYFLIVADFIHWAKSNGVPVGPGRGSGAGSLVAYVLLITDLDPLEYELLFERFLNPERVSMPDFDIDFCMDGRDRVIEYVAKKYGRQSVSQIITFGTMAAKAVVRDVGRVLGHPYGFVDKIAKLIPFELGITLSLALEKEEELARRYAEEDEVRELLNLALKLEGVTRNAGKHAGGVVIAPSKLTDFTAIYCEEGSTQIVSQFDKDDVESAGLVKFDFLGLRTLTIIDWALKIINKDRLANNLEAIDILDIKMDDADSFTLLKACKTTAVFQLESRGMKDLIHRLQPDCFEDIIALVALFRPGPLQSGMVDDFIERKHGYAPVEYMHPDLETILKPTYGIILYQEQVMQIAQVLANYTLGGADLLRRAMGKKKPEEMEKQRIFFTDGAKERGVPVEESTTIFDLIEKFAGYGFNKSHSAAYALIAYQTAWLKAHYPAAFMAAVMSSDMDNTEKTVGFINECANMGLTVLPPSLNNSQYSFTVIDEKTIIYGLGAIKGVGEAAIASLVEDREQNGLYSSMFDLCKRLDLRKINRRVLDALIKSGCMDDFKVERSSLCISIDKALQIGVNHQKHQQSGQGDLFSLFEESSKVDSYVEAKPWSIKERLTGEKETLGLYLTGHPSDPYIKEFTSFTQKISELNPLKSKRVIVCGLIRGIKQIVTKRGKKLAIINLDDAKGAIDIVAFSEIFEQIQGRISVGDIAVVEGELSEDGYTGGNKIMASLLLSVEDARLRFIKCLSLTLSSSDEKLLPSLQSLLKSYQGGCVVQICYSNSVAKATINLGLDYRVNPSDELIEKLLDLVGATNVELCY
ncbi:MAG: DNA polymerase III subunit alpha [Legionellaceae bacterium]|nr:DNA polymerase III subunit alpha [Legionellaceae bacterium]